jgi:predicted house-cleaning noncanonical NTP pyrophosphatase (MazG superfamily)
LDVIRNSLLEIIEKNNNAEEMEKLDKDEFCVNLERRD